VRGFALPATHVLSQQEDEVTNVTTSSSMSSGLVCEMDRIKLNMNFQEF
jgi:hypothetical protein